MSKRDDYLNALAASKENALGAIQNKTNVVDDVVNDFNKKATEEQRRKPTELKKPVERKAQSKNIDSIIAGITPKENRTIHKNFMVTKEISDKLAACAKQLGVSETEVINQILKNAFQ